ncbi:hypothetical protein DVR12_11175 [Chitinophaga silvatica]|uniref:CHRD domain-containing protein n=1 Tax=Chitinophaga silvatica TaxID=2282649 RepID=A0A3E1Y9M1_9BACT|nr:hypothetical protein [Chitinophaga silvatica]RFS22368.1 hypothetical protein DVR12_11175 [Chitinophaga silvatica]
MLMFKKHALRTGVALATVLGITFASCSKDKDDPAPPTPRSKSFELKGTGADANKKIGEIIVSENTDSSINVVLSLTKNTKDADHLIYFIGGTTTAPKTDTLLSKSFKGNGAAQTVDLFKNVTTIKLYQPADATKDVAFKYNDAIAYSAHLKVLKGTDTLAIGNFGKSN